jgi:2-dehydropantoate 2-reductase
MRTPAVLRPGESPAAAAVPTRRRRFVVYGAGAVGGVVGGRMVEHGHDVVFVARGDHGRTAATRGLRVDSPDRSVTLQVAVVDDPGRIDWTGDEVVLLAVKSQDSEGAIRRLSECAPSSISVACLQNGVANEAAALRRFADVQAICVMCPAGHLEPGVVVAFSSPVTALLDVGRYPAGVDGTTADIATAFRASTIESVERPDIMRWKYAKLLMNLANAVDAACGPAARGGPLGTLVREEGEAVLRAAGIDFAGTEEDRRRRGDRLQAGEVPGTPRGGSSSWQSLARGTGSIEADFLNGEIVLLGRMHGVPTPVNEYLQHLANGMARRGLAPGSITVEEVLARIAHC